MKQLYKRILLLFILLNELLFLNKANSLYEIGGTFKLLRFLSFLFFITFSSQVYAQNCTINAGINQTICPGNPFILTGSSSSALPLQSSPVWTQIAGPAVTLSATAINGNNATATVSNFAANVAYTFRLTGKCQDGSTVFQNVTYTVSDLSLANAGIDRTVCPGSLMLQGSPLAQGETGRWTKISGNNEMPEPVNPTTANATLNIPTSPTIQTATYRWTLTKGDCTTFDDVVIKNLGTQAVSAGSDRLNLACYNVTTATQLFASYAATDAASGQKGTWSFVSGPSVPNFGNVNSHNTTVSNLVQGSYILRWTVTGPCFSGSDEMLITVNAATQNITQAGNRTDIYCDGRTSVVLTGPRPNYAGETVTWVKNSGAGTQVIQSPNSNVTIVTGLNATVGNNYRFTYTITNPTTGCSSTGNYDVQYKDAPAINITNTNPFFVPCGETEAIINYSVTGGTRTQYALVSAPSGSSIGASMGGLNTFTNAISSGTKLTGFNKIGTYVIRYRRSTDNTTGGCDDAYKDITIVISSNSTTSNAGTRQVLDCNIVTTALAGNPPTSGIGTWSQVEGPNAATFNNPSNPTATVSGLVSGLYTFRWIISGGDGGCTNTQQDVDVVVSIPISIAVAAGAAKSTCFGTPVILDGNVPLANETGTWSVTKGGVAATEVVFSNVNDPKAIATGLVASTAYTFRWTVGNNCSNAFSEVIITTTATLGPKQALAGPDQCLAANITSFVLAGNAPSNGETGEWVIIPDPAQASGSFVNPTLYNTSFTGAENGTYVLEWRLSNNGCAATTDQVQITISDNPTTAAAGPDQNICGTSVTLAANLPTVGQGVWTQTEGAGGVVITDPTLPTTTVTGLVQGRYKFTWTINNGACVPTANADEVVINISTPPTLALAGNDQTLCNQTSTTLAANSITMGTGRWAAVSGPSIPTFADINNPTTTVSNLSYGVYVLEWISTGGLYCPTSADQMTITVTQNANAGADQQLCDLTTIALTGNPNSIGVWTQISGPNTATLTSIEGNGAIVSDLITGDYVFRYTIADIGTCPETYDEVTYNISSPPTISNAGPDQEICASGTIAAVQLAANAPEPGGGQGTWTVENQPSGSTYSFSGINLANSTFTPNTEGVYLLRWSIRNGNCSGTSASSDFVRITISFPPTVANAGADQNNLCTSNVTLVGNTPAIGLGTWTLVSAPAANTPTINQPNSPTTSILGTVPGTYVFRWTIRNGVCSPSADDVQVIVSSVPPTVSNAGTDINVCTTAVGGTGSTALNGNQPTGTETGIWTVFAQPSGAAPTFANATIYNTAISSLRAGTYTLRWTLNNGSCSSFDDVLITVGDPPSTATITSGNQSVCLYQPVNLTAAAITSGTGTWSTQTKPNGTGGPIFNNVNATSTGVFGLEVGTYTFIFTVSTTSNCTASVSTPVTVTVSAPPTPAITGINQTTCFNSAIALSGNTPTSGTGTWTVTSGQASSNYTFSNINSPTSTFTANLADTYTVTWTVSSGGCTSSSSNTVTVQPELLGNVISTSNATLCAGTRPATTAISAPTGGAGAYNYQWQSSSDGINFVNIASATSAAYQPPTLNNSGNTTLVYSYRRLVNSGNCATSTSNIVAFTVEPAIAGNTVTALTSNICFSGATAVITGATVTGGNGAYTYQWQSSLNSTSTYTDITNGTAANYDPGTLTNGGNTILTYRYRRIVTSGSCDNTSTAVAITVNPRPTLSSTLTATVCGSSIFNYTPTSAVLNTTFNWTRAAVTGISNIAAAGTGAIAETLVNTTTASIVVNYIYTLTANGCQNPTTYNLAITVNPSPRGTNATVTTLDCVGNFTYNLQNNINATTAIPSTFAWTVAANANVSGKADGTGAIISQSLVNHTNVVQQVIYTITPTATSTGSCAGQPFTLTVTVPVCPGMTITKTTSRTTAVTAAGDLIPYTIVVSNTANADQTNVVVNDPFISAQPLVNPVKTGGNTDNILNRGETWTYSGSYTVLQSDLDNNGKPTMNSGAIVNTASVSSTELPAVQTSSTSVNILATSAYTVTKNSTVTAITTAGQVVPYTIVVTNTGNTAINTIVVNDPMLTNISLSSGDINSNGKLDRLEIWTYSGSHTVTQAELDANGNVSPTANGTLRNVVAVSGNKPDGTLVYPSPLTAQKIIPITAVGSLQIIKNSTTTSITKAGQVVPYTITVANTGKVAVSTIVVTDPLLPNSSLTLYSGDIAPANNKLDVNETWTYTGNYIVSQTDIDNNGKPVVASTFLSNQASVAGVYPNGSLASATSNTVNIPIEPFSAFTIAKTADKTELTTAGQVVNYTITVKNTGDAAISAVNVADPMISLAAPQGDDNTNGKLDVGETWAYIGAYTVKQADLDANGNNPSFIGMLSNTASVGATKSDGTTFPTQTITHLIPLNTTSSFSITKTANRTQITAAGQVVTYTIAVRNTGATAVHSIQLTDPMLSSITGPTGNAIPLNQLDVNESWIYTGSYTVTQANIDNQGNLFANGMLRNTANVTGLKPDGTNAGSASVILDIPIVPAASFTVAKTSTVTSVNKSGDLIPYTVTVNNTGGVAINTLVVTDAMVNLTYNTGDANLNGKMDVNEPWIYTGTYRVSQADIDNNGNGTAGKLTNEVTVTGRTPAGVLLPEVKASNEVSVVTTATMAIAKASPTLAITKAGQVVPYIITLKNTGTVALDNIVVTDPLINTAALVLTTGDANGNNKLDVNETWSYVATYIVSQTDIDNYGNGITLGNLVNRATVAGNSPSGALTPVMSNAVTIPLNVVSAYAIQKTSPTAAVTVAGQVVPYTITVRNTGDASIANVAVTDPMLANTPLALVSGDANNNGKLDVSETWTYQANYTVSQTDIDQNGNTTLKGVLTNTANVIGNAPNGTALAMLSVTKVIPLNSSTSFTVDKTADRASVNKAGDQINYTITVTNTGNTSINNIVVNDPLTGGNINTITTGDGNGNNVLDVNEVWTFNGSYITNQADIDNNGNSLTGINTTANGNIVNVVTVSGTKPDGATAGTVSATNLVPIQTVASFTLVKTSDVTEVSRAGDQVVYTVVAKNTGAVAINTFIVNDPMLNLAYLNGDTDNDGKLDLSETWTYRGSYTVKQTDIDNNGNGVTIGKLVNRVTANGRKPDGSLIADVSANHDVDINFLATMTLLKSSTTNLITAANQVVPYTITLANTGTVTITNIVVADPMLANLAYQHGDINANNSLDVNETWTYNGSYAVTQADIDANGNTALQGSLVNTASVSGNNVDGSPTAIISSTKNIPIQQTIALTFTKIATGQVGYIAGQTVTYEIKVTNNGNTTMKDIVVSDANAVVTNGSPIIQLNPGQVVFVTAVHTLTQADVDAGRVVNQASLSGTDANGNPFVQNSDDPSTTVPLDPTITQIVSPGYITLVKTAQLSGDGNTITYNFMVKNTGIVTLSDLTISDTKIQGAISVNPATLAPGAVGTASAVYTITAIEKAAEQVTNTAIVTGTSPNGFKINDVSGTNENNNEPTLVILPKITGTKSVTDANTNGITEQGEELTYTITITNNGSVSRTGVSVSDPIPGNTVYVNGSASNGGSLITGAVEWANLTVPANGNLALSFKVTAANNLPLGLTKITNMASIQNPAMPITPVFVETSLPTAGKLESTKTVDDAKGNKDGIAQANEILSYHIQIKNSGGSNLTGIKVSDIIPNGMAYVNASVTNGGSYTQSGNVLDWTVNIAAGANITLSFDVKVVADVNGLPTIRNAANILSPTGQTLQPEVNIATDPSADIVITKELLTKTDIRTGDRIAYKISVVNAGQNKATGVKVTDILPGTLDAPYDIVVDKGTHSYVANGRNLTWTIGDLALNELVTVTFKTRVVATGSVVNTATVISDQPDPISSSNIASSGAALIGGKDLFIPNLFTPNGDGNNDRFEIIGIDQFPDNELVIVNRWGNEVFRATNYQNNWTGEGLNEGTYYYLLKAKRSGETDFRVLKGYTTLIRAFKR